MKKKDTNEVFRELMASAMGKSPEDLKSKEPEKICDVFVQRIFYDEGMKKFDFAVSLASFVGNDLEEASTVAKFKKWSLAKRYARQLSNFYESQGYETHLKGEVGEIGK